MNDNDPLKSIRDELGAQFARAAATEDARSGAKGRPRAAWLVGIGAALLVPATIALASELGGDDTYVVTKDTVTRNGEVLDCPLDSEAIEQIGFDPCNVLEPAPAPGSPEALEGLPNRNSSPQPGSTDRLEPAPAPGGLR